MASPPKRQTAPDVVDKWGLPVAERGFAQVPNYLLLLNQFLDEDDRLGPAEMLLLVQLVGAWWKKDAPPFPSIRTLSLRTGVSPRQVQRAIKSLEEKGMLKSERRRVRGIISSNVYDLTPLVGVLNDVAKVYPNEKKRTIKGAAVSDEDEC